MPPKAGASKSNKWHVRGLTPKGHKYNKSTGIEVKNKNRVPSEVYEFERTLVAKLDAEIESKQHGVFVPANMPVSLESLEKLYWERLETRSTAEETKAGYRKAWSRLHVFFDAPEKWQSPHMLAKYSRDRQNEGARPPTIKKELNVLLGAYSLAAEGGMILPRKPNRPDNFDDYEKADTAGKYVSPEDFHRFLMILRKQRNGLESSDRLLLCYLTGLRWGETNRLGKAKVLVPVVECEGLKRIIVVSGKGGKPRPIPLGPLAWQIWQRSVPFKSYSNHQGVTRLSKRLGMQSSIKLRDGRASFATEVADGKIPQASIDAVMGHAKGTPAIYQKAHARRLAAIALESETIYADAVAAVEGSTCGVVADHAPRLNLVKIESA